MLDLLRVWHQLEPHHCQYEKNLELYRIAQDPGGAGFSVTKTRRSNNPVQDKIFRQDDRDALLLGVLRTLSTHKLNYRLSHVKHADSGKPGCDAIVWSLSPKAAGTNAVTRGHPGVALLDAYLSYRSST